MGRHQSCSFKQLGRLILKKVLPGILLIVLSVFIADRFFPQIRMRKLTVVTIPGGALVTINGVPSGISPFSHYIPRDGVFVVAEKAGFFAADSLIDSSVDTLFLQLREGSLVVINTIPAGCQIISHGFSGISPCSMVVKTGSSLEITAMGEMGISVSRTVNVLTPGARVVTVAVPFRFTDETTGLAFSVVSDEMLPFAMGPLTVGSYEVTASQFAEFMNSVDPELRRNSTTLLGRTCLMDSILKCNWRGPVCFNEDTTAYAPVQGLGDHPMTGVTWDGAVWYCMWLSDNSATGLQFRLPSCREWELLATPGADLAVNLSDINETILTRHPELDDGWRETAPSGAMGQSRWGLSEMQGNVWEWSDERGIAVGGSWLSSAQDCRADSRIELDNHLGFPFVGMRVVATGFPEDILPGSNISGQEADNE